jgi:hypothetical protein
LLRPVAQSAGALRAQLRELERYKDASQDAHGMVFAVIDLLFAAS